MNRCDICPISEQIECRGETIKRFCDRMNPEHPDYEPSHIKVLARGERGKPIATQSATAVRAIGRFVGSGFKIASPSDQAMRRIICNGCDRFDASQGRCLECSCIIGIKTRMASESCPLGLWKATDTVKRCGDCGK